MLSTHVEVVRKRGTYGGSDERVLHARGGGPKYMRPFPNYNGYSPRTWRWSVRGGRECLGGIVLSTHVEVAHRARSCSSKTTSALHALGGGPPSSFATLQGCRTQQRVIGQPGGDHFTCRLRFTLSRLWHSSSITLQRRTGLATARRSRPPLIHAEVIPPASRDRRVGARPRLGRAARFRGVRVRSG